MINRYSWAKDICHKLERNLSAFLDNQTDEANINNKPCYDVNYWLYEEVYKQLGNDDNGQIFLTIFANLQSAWIPMNKDKTTTQQNVCNADINLYKITYMEELKILKPLRRITLKISVILAKNVLNILEVLFHYIFCVNQFVKIMTKLIHVQTIFGSIKNITPRIS
ncbi:hypothetical protein PVMG_04435 [Plasmodium vivax Mauritania I]|uniref:Uncharacterized protein n=1 Tax=Plasmodium vivax Mauritania I TaxID=1035515 RepID=A0A0J9TA44_PLAVI|nr:hypothetical protein PVMG_04435 [Plasmodium vivax Mauritania I]